jgi:hypothetical protein
VTQVSDDSLRWVLHWAQTHNRHHNQPQLNAANLHMQTQVGAWHTVVLLRHEHERKRDNLASASTSDHHSAAPSWRASPRNCLQCSSCTLQAMHA